MKLVTTLFVIVCLFFMCLCSVEPEKISPVQAVKIAENMTYFQDKNAKEELCFSAITVTKYHMDQDGIGITTVDCEKVRHLLVNP